MTSRSRQFLQSICSPVAPVSAELGYRPDIDGLRAVSILIVVSFHAFPSFLPGGFIGVDVFFVISGYLITSIIVRSLENDEFSFLRFYANRVRRLFPALIIVLLACATFGWFKFLPEEYAQLGKHIAGGAAFISNFVIWNEAGYFDQAAQTKPLLHLWSLGVEEQFYLIWPAALFFSWQYGRHVRATTVIVFALSFLANVLGAHYGRVEHDAVATFYAPYTRFWELMAGALVYQASRRFVDWLAVPILGLRRADFASFLGIGLIMIGATAFTDRMYYPGWAGLVPVAGAALVIVSGADATANRWLSLRPLIAVGLISFPLYLWHWPLLVFGRYLILDFGPLDRLGAVIIAFGLASLTYALVERPVRFGVGRSAKAVVASLLLGCVASVGVMIVWRDGIPQRLPYGSLFSADLRPQTMAAWNASGCARFERGPDPFGKCPSVAIDPSKKIVLLWGDSYAGHLSPGFQAVFAKGYNILAYGIGGCAPIIDTPYRTFVIQQGTDPTSCIEFIDAVFRQAAKLKPDRVVLAASWGAYDWRLVGKTVAALRNLGISDIEIVGQPPVWQAPLQRELYQAYSRSIPHVLPTRLPVGPNGASSGPFETDREMRTWANELGLTYISLTDRLCDAEGCLALLDNQTHPVTMDGGHFTVWGSEYVVSTFPP